MVNFTIKGLVAPVFTPINEDSSVNYSLIPEYSKFLTQAGVNAVLVGGTSGEATCLSVEERKKLAEAWIHNARIYDFQVIIQVGGAPLPDVLELTKHAEEIQADAILTLPELYFKPKSPEELVSYLQIVSEAAPTLPLLYYHFPMMSGVDVDAKKFFTLAMAKIPNFKGMKADLGIALQIKEHLTDDKRVFIGNHHLAPAVMLGYDSSIATITNLFPKLVKDILEAVKTSDFKTTRILQHKMNDLVNAIASQGDWVPTMKVAMEFVTGIKVGPPRLPLAALTSEKRMAIAENLRKENIEVFRF